MATGSPNREFTSEELDAMAAAELPVENPETSRTASAAPVASAPTAPEATGSPELAVGDGTSFSMQEPPRGPAMGPVAKLEAGREYSTEELDLIEQANKPKEFTSDELDKATVDALNDPKYIPTRDEFFDQKATKERMVAAGKLPGYAELGAKLVGGLLVSAGDAFNMAVAHPLETIARSPATLQTGFGRASLEALKLGGWAKQLLEGDPKYRDEATGEFFTFSDPDFLRQQMEQGKKLRPTNEEDLKDWEFQNHIYKKGIDSEYQDLGQKAGPTELITRVLTGRNQNELPIESQSQVVEMASDPTNLIPFGAGAKALGLSRGMKLVSSQAAGVVEKLSGGLVKGNDVLAERFAKVVTNTTGLAPEDLTTMGKALNYSKNVGIGAGIAGGAAAVGAPPEVAQFIAGFYPAYKAGLGVLRKIETGAGTAKIIMREAADATNGLDQAARAAVLANNSVPQVFKEVLERPSQFVSIESTPARLAANQSLSPQMRAFMGKLSNPAIVQAVRGSSALAKGAVKGVAINAPFAALAYNAGEDDQAAGMLGAGVAFGAAGAGIDRFTGLQERRQQAAISDVSRMLVDVELNAGDVSKLMSTQTPDNLVKLAAMQGTFRNGLDFVPLNAIDYEKNVSSNGGAGAAGLFLQATPGERARIYINLDAKRQGIEPHEFGHALLASGALDGQQKYAARAWVEKAYGADGIKSRASEYASAIIRAKNSEAFPDGNFEISPGTLASEMDNLTQGGLARGDMDGLDWARDEIFAETFAKASQSMDFSAIRRGAPAGGNVLTFAEGILGAQSRALSASGVRIDPQTGAPLDTPDALFKENPLLATDKNLINQLGTYINNYRQWANDPTHEKPRPNKVAPSGRASDVINNPQVTFYDRGDGVKATTFAVQDPVTGQAVLRDQRDLNAEHAKVKDQLKALGGSKLLQPSDPVLGPKKTTDGRVTVRGRVLPQSFDFLNGFMPHIRNFARQFEALGAAGESMQVRYHAIGSGDSGAFQIKKLGNLEAITREVVPWGWELTKAGNLNATVLDLSQFRNRAMRAINDHNPALAVFEWDMGKIEGDLKQWMQNHRDELPGNTKIGDLKRDVLNSLVGVATTENRSRNPLHGSFGPGSAIKQFRLDRVDAAVGTGRQGFHFDYEKAKGNFMPDKPAPMPDLSRDLPTGQAMPSAPKPLKPIEEMTDRQLASFLKKHGEQPSSAIDVARRWSDGDRMWGAHEMDDELSLFPITDMNDLSGYSRDRLISLPKTTEDALYNPQGQAMPDAVAGQFMPDTWTSVQDAPEITMKDLVGRKVFPTMADRMAAGTVFRGIDSSEIAIPIETHGGPEWPLIQQEKVGEETNVWTNQGKGVSSTKAKRADEGAVMLVTLMDGNAHLSNTETASAIISTNAAYARDNRMSPEGLAAIDAMIRKDIPNFPGIEDPNIVAFVNKLPFQGKQSRARIAEVLASKQAEEHGAANVQRILDETRSKPYEGGRLGDSVLAIELTKGAPVMELGTMGTMSHPSYQYAVRGRVLGKFKRPVNMELIYEDFLNERRVQGKPQSGDRRAIDLARPVQFITEELANKVTQEKYEHLKSPNHAKVLTQALNDKWRDTTMSVKDGGASPADFITALNASEAKLALDRYTLPELKEKIKTGAMSIHQLGDSQVFFGIKSSDPATGYGLDPAEYGFGPNEKTLSLVLNSEKQTGGMGDAIVLKALQLGVTALDCFAVKSEAHPNGMLPALYRRLGFEKAGEIPFDDTFYTAKELADLKQYWKRSGWDESTGNPSIVLMKWKGNDEIRKTSLRDFARKGGASVRGGTQDIVTAAESYSKRVAGGQNRGSQRRPKQSDSGRGEGSQGASVSGVQLGRGTIGAIDELLGMKPADLQNLGIRAEDLAAFK